MNTTIEIDESVEEDDAGNEVVVAAVPAEVNIPSEKKIEADEQWNLVIDGFVMGLWCTHASRTPSVEDFPCLFSLGCHTKEMGNEGRLPWDVASDHAVQLVPATALSTCRAVVTVIGDRNEQTRERNGMNITSAAFQQQQRIPRKYTCDGQNINPPLVFVDVPQAASSLVLLVDDPDAPRGTWVHWLVYNIPPAVREVKERSVPRDGVEGMTSAGKPGYAGPCPPSGTHRYCFKLYALDAMLQFDRPQRVDTRMIEKSMKDHLLEQAELVGFYSRS